MNIELKNLKEKLGESEEKFKIISSKIPVGIFIIQDNVVKYANNPIAKLLGYSVKEILKWSKNEFYKIFLPQDKPVIIERSKKIMRTGRDFIKYYIEQIITKSGKIKWVEIYTNFVIYNRKKALLVIFIELTKKKRAELRLVKSGKKLQERIKKLNAIFKVSNILDKPNISLDELIYKILGVIPSGFQYPKLISTRIIYRDKEYKLIIFKETGWKITSKIEIADQLMILEVFYLEDRPFLEEEQKLLKDIGKRLKFRIEQNIAEEKLKRSEEKYRETLDLLPSIVFEIDQNLNFVYINKSGFEKFGYSNEEFKDGLNFSKFLSIKDRTRALTYINSSFKRKNLTSKEYLMEKKGGSKFWARIHIRRIYKGGELIGLGGVIIDITSQKRAQEKRNRQIQMVNRKMKELFSSLKIEIKPSISNQEKSSLILFLMDWHDKMGPYLKDYFPKEHKFPFPINDIGFQLYNAISSIYGQAYITEAQGILLNIENIKMDGYIFFDALPDPNFRGKERPYMLGIIAPKINYIDSLKFRDVLHEISQKIKNNENWENEYYWKKILAVLSS